MESRCMDERTLSTFEPRGTASGARKPSKKEEESDFETMLRLEAVCDEFTVQQYQFAEKTVELVVQDGRSVNVWQYPLSKWERYLNWKQARLSMEVV